MKFIRVADEKFEFQFSRQEKTLLLHVLSLYPLVPEAHYRLSKGGQIPDQEENQRLLDESLKAERMGNQKQVLALLNEPGRFAARKFQYHATFTRGEIEWLLQVLNDVRIGSWIALGSPGYAVPKKLLRDDETMRQAAIMDVAGGFQAILLGALNGNLPPEHA
ncbi:MAG: hypothetical protein H7Y43_17235 [Akkermansiaceae bacterium]|nr:hypothetical protein [Verrucomicrobiales bacterium]